MHWEKRTMSGWGRTRYATVLAYAPRSVDAATEAIRQVDARGIVAVGNARSYGDVALNNNGRALLTSGIDQIHSFDERTGEIVCGPGVTFQRLLKDYLPRGFLFPVSPGTGFVTIGGAVANDVHGKNHERAGSFGDHVRWLDLLLSSGKVIRIGPDRHPEWFAATIGGIGLTGIILAVCFTMQRVGSNAVTVREQRVPDLERFLEALETVRATATFSVGWIDALARGGRMGRGIIETAEPASESLPESAPRRLRVPCDFPSFILNPWSIAGFNALYFRRIPAQGRVRTQLLDTFLYPLDSILEWNRLYGARGFYQFQCVLPDAASPPGIRRLLEEISRSRAASFLAVLKTLGGEGRGYLSFPMRGYTLALDFPRTQTAQALYSRLERITLDHGGRVYLAKDASLSESGFAAMYPKLGAFNAALNELDTDCRMRSDMARRLGIRANRRPLHAGARPPSTPVGRHKAERHKDNTWSYPSMNDRSRTNVKPRLLSVEDAKKLSLEETTDLFSKHLNPGQLHFLRLLGFDQVLVRRAEGMYYTDQKGRRILDFFGGFGSLAFGHNHPRILATRKRFQEEMRHEIAIAFMSQYAAALAKNLAEIAPGDLDMVFLGSTGSEAVEAALKLAEKVQGPDRAKIVYAENAFHGKTRGALSVTDSEFYQSTFRLLDNRVRVPFGDAAALENLFSKDPSAGVLILETIQGGGGVVSAPPEYWREVRRLCDQYRVLWIADEVQCGVGRTGRFFAFEHAGVVPDLTALAKSLGGGKSAMGAMIARRPIYTTAYGTPKTALIHGPATFGGIGEACCTAIEALNILYDEGLMENAAIQGGYLIERLQELQAKYPKLIKEVRGQGLMVGLEFADLSATLPLGLRQMVSVLDEKLKGGICGFVGSLLLREFNVLVAFTEYNRNVMRLEPPLIVTGEQINTLVNAMEGILSRGITGIVTGYAKNALVKR